MNKLPKYLNSMKLLITATALICTLVARADHHEKHEYGNIHELDGVWAKHDHSQTPNYGSGFYKVIADGVHRVLWLKEGVLTSMHGGGVTYDGEIMIETPTHSTPNNGLRDQNFMFKVSTNVDSFKQSGIPGSGNFGNLKEQWKRVGKKERKGIEGVWTRIHANGNIMQKVIIDNFWQWVVIDPRTNHVVGSLGGKYSFDGENYVETTQFMLEGTLDNWQIGKQWKAKAIVKKDKLLFEIPGETEGESRGETWAKMDSQDIRKHDALKGKATLNDFKRWVALHSGTWEGKVNSTIGESNLGQNKTPYTVRFKCDAMEIPNLLSTRGIGPNGSFYSTTYYDPSEMKIVSINLGASGTVTESKLYWEKGVWMRNSTYTKPDGQKSDLHSTLRFSDNENTLTILINGEVGQTVVEKQKNIWKRIK